ncbi:hypothetical protein M2J86_24740 (plasmid) [Citrobacter freundii]|uniref:hypothetical protein n=1 Tax=Citrobacter TaxID=544 RepID=UPI0018D15708|nr:MULTISPECIES: hypothetical protein [Citrobacter]EET7320607.1 hypothetical protein [Escherichia coli]DAW18617.1 MAG TPA: hypothetical protein [Caudoviricetes sp.]ELD7994212.1 hypothetical protein [Citrobacter freundii]ELE2066194.1 hypothetical protein [Citrobacter freundii]MBJ8798677.1 hypothetical protein [Citrobacter freundii]
MTPVDMLEGVKKRFQPLLADDETLLKTLLRQALTSYQDKAGVIGRVQISKQEGVSLKLPEDYLALIHVTDSRGGLVYADPYPDSIKLDLDGCERYPLTMAYLLNLRDRDFEKWVIPADIIGSLEDYLEALIAIKNTERLRIVAIAGKLDTSGYPDEITLQQRKQELELQMSANRAIIPGATIL